MTPKTDSQLIDETLGSDRDAFGQLVRKHQDRLYNAMVKVVQCRTEAEDVVQEAFVQAFVKLQTFRRSSCFFTWLYRIALNRAISRQRQKKADQTRQERGDLPVRQSTDCEDPGRRLLRKENSVRIRAALDDLEDRHRTILVLRELEGFDYRTIANILGISLGAVRSRLHRARMRMRTRLREFSFQDGA